MIGYINKNTEKEPVGSHNEFEPLSLASMFKVLSDPTRLRIFGMLMEGTQCNCEIARRLDLPLSLISYHLRILRLANLIESERDPHDERWIDYSIKQDTLCKLEGAMSQLFSVNSIQPRQPCCGLKCHSAQDVPCEY